ncbi:forkhead-associated domain-containing protein kinase [Verticillium alfalfae VaMs.102]|uniref:Forkhead-associated domain-containing protein kinase n=1 Tax=Verticillium alfalfae (strain VaMs.102 / ATCC MYA-4576 / FGSC 10136) TaxID=526221 RepID=C9SHQ2_VERA1|nr:forkhead-associated domain-containing protein kinase [Verticillium alfalfae VaMs.102]EEY18475.1 forkhead-associated domain-containing protein kinase [Verticillium alfalfae VaMs.102]
MAPREKSQLKRLRVSLLLAPAHHCWSVLNRALRLQGSLPDNETESKKPRRSERLSVNDPDKTPVSHKGHLPSPVTHTTEPDANDRHKSPTATPPEGRPSQVNPREETPVQANILSSPPQDTQAFSQYPPETKDSLSDDVEDEVKEGVWGYLFPLDTKYGRSLVMKKRTACPMPDTVADKVSDEDRKGKSPARKEEEAYEKTKIKGIASGGYLIGRHPECDIVIDDPIVSNRHCLLFIENKGGDTVAIVEDLSSNGTFVNEAIVGRNQRRELREQDEIAVLDKARFIFRYPKSRQTSPFHQSYTLLQKLGKGHFAEVFLCVEKSTGQQYAVKVFSKTPGMEERSKQEGLQQEIAVLMGVSHPNVLCLKDTFNERNAVYLVLELAPEGELFNFIVMKQKVSEDETRKLFKQLFQGIKYLEFPYTLSQQIKSGRFDYPSPYWDSVGDPALDLIDSMLVVNVERRFTIDQCLSHPWLTHGTPAVNDSTDGLVGGIRGLEVHRRGVVRERTLLSSLNSVEVTAKIPANKHSNHVKVFAKNAHKAKAAAKESGPAHNRGAGEFMEMGGKGDQDLFANDGNSVYSKTELASDKTKNKSRR